MEDIKRKALIPKKQGDRTPKDCIKLFSAERKARGHATGYYTMKINIVGLKASEIAAEKARLRERQRIENMMYKYRCNYNDEDIEFSESLNTIPDDVKSDSESESETEKVEKCEEKTEKVEENVVVCPEKVEEKTETVVSECTLEGSKQIIENSPDELEWDDDVELNLDVDTGNTTALLGSSKQGKTYAMMYLYRRYKDYYRDFINILFAASSQLDIYGEKNLISSCEYKPIMIDLAHRIQVKTKNHYQFLFMLDDIVDRRDDVTLKKLILTLRNSKISSMICLQYSNLLSKVARANVNNLLLFGFNSDEAIDLIVRQFLTSYMRKNKIPQEDWVDHYKLVTRDHGFFYVHPSSGNISIHRLNNVKG